MQCATSPCMLKLLELQMDESPKSPSRRSWQFSLRRFFVAVLVVAAFDAGYAQRNAELQGQQIVRKTPYPLTTYNFQHRRHFSGVFGLAYSVEITQTGSPSFAKWQQ